MTTTQPNPQQDFSSTVRAMWETRPPRIPKEQGGNAQIAGVCEGIGVRYQIDPTIVRIFFALSAFLGGGLAAYFLAWLVMPRYSLPLSPLDAVAKPEGKQFKKERELGWWLIIGTILVWGSIGTTPAEFLGSSTVLTFVLIFGAWYLLYKRMPLPPTGLLTKGESVPVADLSSLHPVEGYNDLFGRQTPPAWDPLGAAPFAWDLPEPGPAPEPKKKTSVWSWLLGIAIAFAAAPLIAGSIFATVYWDHNDYDVEGRNTDFGNATIAVTSEEELQNEYDFGVGDFELDLSDLGALNEDRTIDVRHGVGKMNVFLPTDTPVKVNCYQRVGDSTCPSGTQNPNADGKLLTLNVRSGVGDLVVHTQ